MDYYDYYARSIATRSIDPMQESSPRTTSAVRALSLIPCCRGGLARFVREGGRCGEECYAVYDESGRADTVYVVGDCYVSGDGCAVLEEGECYYDCGGVCVCGVCVCG
jgi:hypothetical protein